MITKTPVILEVFSSNPYPKSQNQCLTSLNIWNKYDHINPITKNFPKKELKKLKIVWQLSLPKIKVQIQKQSKDKVNFVATKTYNDSNQEINSEKYIELNTSEFVSFTKIELINGLQYHF